MKQNIARHLDWISIICYILLVTAGWLTVYSTTVNEYSQSIFDLKFHYGKQLMFILLCIPLILFILATDTKFYDNFSFIFYVISILSLVGLFVFGKKINGATSWYHLGAITLQPSEFAKVATSLFLAKYLSSLQTDIRIFRDFFRALLIIAIPGLLIVMQPDPGSLLVFMSLIFVFYREGMAFTHLSYLFLAGITFIITLKFGVIPTIILIALLTILGAYIAKKRTNRFSIFHITLVLLVSITVTLTTPILFNKALKTHHRNRVSLWLRLENDPTKLREMRQNIAYNTYRSESAISSGGILGKGFLEGTHTRGNFVPEQQTDYIFTNLGEEWGLVGTVSVVLLFTFLLLRLIILAEKQRSKFSRIFGYCVVSILFIHFLVNIGMVIGIVPTIGIPLPFFSYGGSGLLAFTMLVFIFLRLAANRIHDSYEKKKQF